MVIFFKIWPDLCVDFVSFVPFLCFPFDAEKTHEFCLNDEKPAMKASSHQPKIKTRENQPPPPKKSTNIQQTKITVVKNSQDLAKSFISSYYLTLFL